MAFTERFSTIERGGIKFIGNTLGLSKATNTNTAGPLGSIGAFTSLTNSTVPTFPEGTTLNYLLNGSPAVLNLPAGSSILYAELIWGGLYISQTQNISAEINNPITFTINNTNFSITSDVATRQNLVIPSTGGFNLGFYVRTANVTSIVSPIINATYSVSAVPALAVPIDNQTSETNHAGWTLAIVYKNNSNVLRNLTLWVGGAPVGPSTPVTDIALTGFLTPQVAPINGKAFISAQEGDAIIDGDQFLFGKDSSSLVAISGPNNPINNFFCSQINNENGLIETSGTFGDRNANAAAGTNISAGRQGWDITAVDISSQLETNQNSALFRFTSSGDLYVPNALATQIDSLGASLTITKSVDDDIKVVGEEITYTLNITNTGELAANNIEVSDVIPLGLTLVDNSIFVDGVLQPNTFPIMLNSINPSESKQIVYKLVANSVPSINPAVNIATVNYNFEPFAGFTVNNSSISNPVSVAILNEQMNLIKTVDKVVAQINDILLYSSFIVNNGTLNAKNIVFTDNIPDGTTFVENSVTIDDVEQIGANPESGIDIGVLAPTQFKTVTFKVKINNNSTTPIVNSSRIDFESVLPDGETVKGSEESNIVSTDVITYLFLKEKSTSKSSLEEGETATQTINLINNSKYTISNIQFSDVMTSGATFVNSSVKINDVSFPAFDVISGFALPDILSGESTKITYDIIANNPKTDETVNNYGTVNFTVESPEIDPVNFVENTNTITINLTSLNLELIKEVNKTCAYVGTNLHYTTTVKNNNSLNVENAFFKDELSNNLKFIKKSVKINGINFVNLDPTVGFYLPNINENSPVVVEFDVKILCTTFVKYVKNISMVQVGNESSVKTFYSNIVSTRIKRRRRCRPINIYLCCGCCNNCCLCRILKLNKRRCRRLKCYRNYCL